MPKYATKTYGRFGQKPNNASQAFDEIFKPKVAVPAVAKPVTTTAWIKPAVVTNRQFKTDDEGNKRRRCELRPTFGDPFSFESDEDSPKKKSPRRAEEPELTIDLTDESSQIYSSKATELDSVESCIQKQSYGLDNSNSSHDIETIGNGKSVEKEVENTDPDNHESGISNNSAIPYASKASGSAVSRLASSLGQLTKNTQKLPVSMFLKSDQLEKDDETNKSKPGNGDHAEDKGKAYNRPRKFFKSRSKTGKGSQGSKSVDHTYSHSMYKVTVSRKYRDDDYGSTEGSDGGIDSDDCKTGDHNYSFMSNRKRLTADHTYSSVNSKQKLDPFLHRASVSGEHAYGRSLEEGSSKAGATPDADSDSGDNYLYDSDNELTSGDPEIIFNSPSKRAKEAAKLAAGESDTFSEETSDYMSQNVTDSQASVISISSKTDSEQSSQDKQEIRTYSRKKGINTDNVNLQKDSKSRTNNTGSQEALDGSSAGRADQKYEIFRSKKLKTENEYSKAPIPRRILTSPKKARPRSKNQGRTGPVVDN